MRVAGRYRTGSFPPGPARPGPAAPDGRVCGGGCRGRAAGCRHDGPGPDGAARTTRLLVLRALGLGDLLAGVPALRALRRAHPGHGLVPAARPGLAPVAEATGAVDRLLPASALPGRAVPRTLDWTGPPPPDIAVGLHGNGPPSHRLLLVLRPLKPPPGPAQDRRPVLAPGGAQTLLRAYGIDADPGDLLLPRPRAASPAPGAVVLHPGAGSPARCRPVERYAAVAAGLRDRGLRVVVTGGPAEGDLVARLAKSAGLPDTDVSDGGLPRSNCCPLSWPTPRRDQRRYRHRPPRGRPRHTLDRPVRPGRTEPLGPAGPTRHRALR
ncbi:glycosyltransferase family 9 protein [Streptomyces collinus]|uniref:glycosyltransferase family 9 protein n=1 Tax=Streptomyces collinus TaxID=42684 RepID=UPI00369B9C20